MNVSFSGPVVPDPQQYKNTHDLTKLEQITLENVLDCLVNRFVLGNFYTFAGSVLISLNPCLKIDRKSMTVGIDYNGNGSNVDDEEGVESSPHVYSIGKKCLDNLYINGNNQIVVVSGDSGSGKTTATQQLLCYFIDMNKERCTLKLSSPNLRNLERKIYCSTLILEAMGNACTTSNPNSSRFGRLVQLNYKNVAGVETIIGAQIQTCLLEKYRFTKFGRERNFHIFYYVLVAMQKGLFDMKIFLDFNADPLSLIPSYFLESFRKTDESDFDSFWQSILTLKMTSEIQSVFQIIYGVMVLLNMQFTSPTESHQSGHKNPSLFIDMDEKENQPMNENILESQSACKNSSYSFFGSRNKVSIANVESLEPIEEILGVDLYSLLDSILARSITAGRRKSTVRKPCESIKECQDRLFALVSKVYDSLFTFILHRLNSILGVPDSTQNDKLSSLFDCVNTTKTVSLLDLYGFEKLETNHLEQLCINYANERLQQVHISHIKSLMSQMSPSSSYCEITRVQQEFSARLDGLHSTIFTILDEACMLNRSQTDDQVYNCLRASIKDDNFIRVKKLQDQNCPFLVQHYATKVEYYLKGMVDKNRDYIPPEFLDLLQSSSTPTVKSMFTSETEIEAKSKGGIKERNLNNKTKREKTILQRFKTSVEKLIDQLEVKNDETQDVQFIRCIRPNNDLIKGKVERDLIKDQLYAVGIVDLIRISANGYPIRIPTVKFFKKFRTIILRCFSHHGSSSSFEQERFRASFNFKKSQLRFGVTQVFMTEETWHFLLQLEQRIFEKIIVTCQRTWRDIRRLKAEKEAGERARLLIEEMLRVKSQSRCDIDTELDFYEDAVEFLATSTPAPNRHPTCRSHYHRSLNDLCTATNLDSLSHHGNFHGTPFPPVNQELDEFMSTPRLRRRAKNHSVVKSRRSKSSDNSGRITDYYPGPQGDIPRFNGIDHVPLVFLDPHDPMFFTSNKKSQEKKQLKKSSTDDKDCQTAPHLWEAFRHSSTKLFTSEDQSIVSKRCIYKGPIKFYTKRTALMNNHVIPLRLRGQGLADLLDDYIEAI